MVAAVAHLVILGHTAIAHVTGPDDLSMTHVRRAFAALMERRSPTAVIAGNDMIAIGCYAALRGRGLNCPSDVSVVGFNDMPLSGFLDPPLTTVAIPQYDIGAAAAEMVLRRIGGHDQPEHRLLPTELMGRGSTAAH